MRQKQLENTEKRVLNIEGRVSPLCLMRIPTEENGKEAIREEVVSRLS